MPVSFSFLRNAFVTTKASTNQTPAAFAGALTATGSDASLDVGCATPPVA